MILSRKNTITWDNNISRSLTKLKDGQWIVTLLHAHFWSSLLISFYIFGACCCFIATATTGFCNGTPWIGGEVACTIGGR